MLLAGSMRTFGPSLASLLITVAACAGTAPSDVEKPTGGKADEVSRLCEALGEPTGCDPCDAAGWYGDGECDTFCPTADSDCDAAPSEVAAFLAQTPLQTSWGESATGRLSFTQNSFVVTELSQATADAWATTHASLVGSGLALHVTFTTDDSLEYSPWARTIALYKTVYDNGECSVRSANDTQGAAVANVFRWTGATATPIACSRGGSITVSSANGKVLLHLLAELNDGTTVDQTFEAEIRDR